MIFVYIACAIFGGAFLVPMLIGGLDNDLGDGFEGDLEGFDGGLDVDGPELDGVDSLDGGDLDGPTDGSGLDGSGVGVGPLGAMFASLLSFRTVVFFAAFFGAAGIAFDLLGYGTGVTAATASLIGIVAAVANSMLFGLVRSSQNTSQLADRAFEGRPGRVVLPMAAGSRGRIRIDLAGQPQYLVARPISSAEQLGVGDSVVVVGMENGTALVAPLPELDDLDPT